MIYDKMSDCFKTLNTKINNSLNNSDLDSIFNTLDSITGPTIVCGVGGSSIVGKYLSKVLREKNHIVSTFILPRDIQYMDLSGYENIIAVSYSGSNIGVDVLLDTKLNKYLFTGKPRDGFTNMVYKMDPEVSYVSISATLTPMAILLMYYCRDKKILDEILSLDINTTSNNNDYEVMSGYETNTAEILLESSLIEGGLGSCIVHDKYNYCHGRINLTKIKDSDLIFFKSDNELDNLLYVGLSKHYKNIININNRYDDLVINDFYASYLSMKLIEKIAINKDIDISDMKELEDNDMYYLFKGKMK